MNKIMTFLKRVIIITICITSVLSAIVSTVPVVKADSSGTLNTGKALGSPILNNNFASDDWNKWEMVCWGVFLSNFCQPLIDTYESAFTATGTGSNGAGYAALCFGSGSDNENNKIIEQFASYAITEEKKIGLKDIFVAYTEIDNNVIQTKLDPNALEDTEEDQKKLREATAADLFFNGGGAAGNTTSYNSAQSNKYDDKYGVQSVNFIKAYVPTFYIKNSKGKYIEILDYTNSWDIQAFGAMINSVRSDDNSKELFQSNFSKYINESTGIGLDAFGNIVTKQDRVMVFPSANNQHITKDKSINILNSWILNSYIHTYTQDELVQGLHQNNSGWTWGSFNPMSNGLPAFGKSVINNPGLFYFDLDTVIMQDYPFGSDGYIESMGTEILNLFKLKINNSDGYNIKFEVAGNGFEKLRLDGFGGGGTLLNSSLGLASGLTSGTSASKDSIAATLLAASLIPNIAEHENNTKMLDSITTPDGDKLKIFSDETAAVAVQVVLKANDKGSAQNGETLRAFYNWLYQAYKGKYGQMVSYEVVNSLESLDTVGNLYTQKKLLQYFKESTGGKYSTEYLDGWWDRVKDNGNNETFSKDCARLTIVYPVSNVMKAVSEVLCIADGTEFNVYSTYIYMTYLEWYGITNKKTLGNSFEASSNFNTDIFEETSDILNKDINDFDGIKTKEQKEEEIFEATYKLLSLEDGREYRKKLIYNGISDFLYEQYNRIVYGGSSSIYTGVSTKSGTGFLAVPTFDDNFLTSWFLSKYVNIAVYLIMGCMILMIVIGLLKSRRFSWFIIGTVIIVNVILIVPATGEITPYITTSIVQKMFMSKMTFWALSEDVANASLAASAATQSNEFEDLTSDEAAIALKLVNQLSVLYTDRSLMLKQDISQKLTQNMTGAYAEIQSYPSARWVLPMVMQQFSATEEQDTDKYVYVKLANVLEDASNIYWYYKPSDAAYVTKPTATSKDFFNSLTSSTSSTTDENGDETTEVEVNITDSTISNSYTAEQNESSNKSLRGGNIGSYFGDYKAIDQNRQNNYNYRNYAYTIASGTSNSNASDSATSDSDNYSGALNSNTSNDMVHTYFYILHDGSLGMGSISYRKELTDNFKNADSWQGFIDIANGTGLGMNWATNRSGENSYESISDTYDRTKAKSMKDGYGYYKSTESAFYYFFAVVKDQFPSSTPLAGIIGRLQGTIEYAEGSSATSESTVVQSVDTQSISGEQPTSSDSTTSKKEVRSNFMYATITSGNEEESLGNTGKIANTDVKYTGLVRDVCDLEYFLTNTVPYMYEMNLAACGFDGESGILGDSKITSESALYEGNLQSWAYRCNWAIKLMENPSYCKSDTAYDSSGNKYVIKYPIMPDSYPDNRPMVFSEAQREAYGLKDSDLTVVELKCIKVNNEVAKQWTLLINYANTSGLTKEVLFRQMGLIATEEFNKEFSSGGVLYNDYSLFPQSIDLRYISFDAIMKMIMVNVSRNTSYAYGDSMLTLLTDSDLFTAFLLWLCAVACAWLVPLFQCVILAVIFYLGFIAIIRSLFSSAEYKGKVAGAQLISNLLFMLYTTCYYAVFALIINISAQDEVLTVNSITTNIGNPVWALLVVFLVSVAYLVSMYFHVTFCFKHYRDMGAAAYSVLGDKIISNMHNMGSNISNGLGSLFNSDDNVKGSTGNTSSMQGTGLSSESAQSVVVINSNKDEGIDPDALGLNDATDYETGDQIEASEDVTPAEIDAEIEAGREMGND